MYSLFLKEESLFKANALWAFHTPQMFKKKNIKRKVVL